MNCWRIKKLLSAYVDDELGSSLAAQVKQHLRDCEMCRRELARYESLKGAMMTLHTPLPNSFTERVISRTRLLPREAEGRRSIGGLSPSWRYALATLGVAGMVLVALMLGFNPNEGLPGAQDPNTLTSVHSIQPTAHIGEEKKPADQLHESVAEIIPLPEHYLAEHLANSELQTATSQDISRHVIANEALTREAGQRQAPAPEYPAGMTFSMVSSGAPRHIGADTAGLPTLPIEDDEEESADADEAIAQPAAEAFKPNIR